jgi:hypothetical protein
MKLYSIEQIFKIYGVTHEDKYRFRSLFNGTVGYWCYNQKLAIEQGEQHQKIILALHNKSLEDIFQAEQKQVDDE